MPDPTLPPLPPPTDPPPGPGALAPGGPLAGDRRALTVPVWASAFRPFYLLGCLHAGWVMLASAAAWLGQGPDGWAAWPLSGGRALWHGHEMLFGFAMAIVTGTVLTALPSWAGTAEIRGRALAGLALLWGLGRVAVHGVAGAPPGAAALAAALVDAALPLALLMLLSPQLLRCADRRYALLLPVLLVLLLANLAFHAALARGDATAAAAALRAALWALVVLFALKGGVLTPVFTGNVLVERGRGTQAPWCLPLEWAALGALVLLAVVDLGRWPAPAGAVLATLAALTQAWRLLRWRGWRVLDEPLVTAMNAGMAWLVVSLLLRAATAWGAPLPESTWIHAFTIGALGSMMLGLMTRVALRHTGRPLQAPQAMPWLLVAMAAATVLRLLAGIGLLGPWAVASAALLWTGCFLLWLAAHGHKLLGPSLPRQIDG